jgi:glutamine synthetase
VVGADANPYLAMAVTLACGYLGIVEKLKPTEVTTGSAYASDYQLPRGLSEAIRELENAKALHEVLGKDFIDVYLAVKETEHDEFMRVISPWEREHLLMHV